MNKKEKIRKSFFIENETHRQFNMLKANLELDQNEMLILLMQVYKQTQKKGE